ncbi:glycoside hydrolase family 18 protein, partial [Myriangium duriaei CBS 260.36]
MRARSLVALLAGLAVTSSPTHAQFISQLSKCPQTCQASGPDPALWTYYHHQNALDRCDATTLFELNLYNSVSDPSTHIALRACTVSSATAAGDIVDLTRRDGPASNSTTSSLVQAEVSLATWNDDATKTSSISNVTSAVGQLASYLNANTTHVDSLFARSGTVLSSAVALLQDYIRYAESSTSLPQRQAVQFCGSEVETTSPRTFGLFLDTAGNTSAVQDALRSWDSAICLTAESGNTHFQTTTIKMIPPTELVSTSDSVSGPDLSSFSNATSSNSSTLAARSNLVPRASCKYIQAQAGDGCWSLAQRCGITQDQVQQYNGGSTFCTSVIVGQYVCCSPGSKPDFSPKPTHGQCFPYTVQSGDTCYSIAQAHQMQTSGIETNNAQTWGWMGCSSLWVGMKICLSSGNPPFPANVPNALCGPQINNTATPSDPTTWSSLNECPLNACCDMWGQCGTTSEFCDATRGPTGNPGTAPPGNNGCISNCGTDIVAGPPVASMARVGYFEAYNGGRPCLHMAPSDIPGYYTHVHYAFGSITNSFNIDMSENQDVWQQFLQTSGHKKIVSFGGWGFSTEPATYNIFRAGTEAGNRQTLANNVAAFVKANGLDGVDFDWEYPGAYDIPGTPPGSGTEGADYLAFLQLLRPLLPSGVTISIAAPSSYWYLRGFPIADMGKVVDYIVYMTYDLHGQWDYGNKWTDPGCSGGNCLRSQVNLTETIGSLSMITKAGVPANKIMLGQPLYGRSFQMTTPGCWGEMCTYTGPASGATPGRCTGVSGYISNWEIREIMNNGGASVQQYHSLAAGDIVVYDDDQWISWVSDSTYNMRSTYAQSKGIGGTSDWAIDLNSSYDLGSNQGAWGSGSGIVYIDPEIFTDPNPTIACYPPCIFIFPPWILPNPTTIAIPPVTSTIEVVEPLTTTAGAGIVVTSYVVEIITTVISFPPIVTNTISIWDIEWTDTNINTIYLTSSVVPPPVTMTLPPWNGADASTTTSEPGFIWSYQYGPYPPYTGPTVGPPPGTQPPLEAPTPGPPPPPPPPGLHGSVTVTVGPPRPTCTHNCGSPHCHPFCLPELHCGGLCHCIGHCGSEEVTCVGNCGGDGGTDGGSNLDPDNDPECSTSSTVFDCSVGCSVTDFGDTSLSTSCFTTSCSNVVTCATQGTTSTSETTTTVCPATAQQAAAWSPPSPNAPMPYMGADGQYTYGAMTAPPITS